jgi:hypothetical protein
MSGRRVMTGSGVTCAVVAQRGRASAEAAERDSQNGDSVRRPDHRIRARRRRRALGREEGPRLIEDVLYPRMTLHWDYLLVGNVHSRARVATMKEATPVFGLGHAI